MNGGSEFHREILAVGACLPWCDGVNGGIAFHREMLGLGAGFHREI